MSKRVERQLKRRIKNHNDILEYAENRYKELKGLLKRVGSERQDLLHILEMNNLDDEEMIFIAKQIKNIQLRRRQIKDDLLYYKEIVSYLKNRSNSNKVSFRGIKNKLREIEREMGDRVYYLRVRKDLIGICNEEFKIGS